MQSTHQEDAAKLFARFKSASGGSKWDDVLELQDYGTLTAGGLSGEFHAKHDLLTGRLTSRYRMGSVDGGAGFDGHTAWQRGPGGEIAVLNAPEAKRRARSQAWLDARAYWYPQRMPASYSAVETIELDGRAYHAISAYPEDGDPLVLWLLADTHLLGRIVRRRGADTVTTVLDDYRNIEGLHLPFRSTTDRADATGQIDRRLRMQIDLERISVSTTAGDADFAIPAMAENARIDDASGITRIPFELINNHIYVNGEIDGHAVRFMVDTGGANLLTPEAAKRLGLSSEGKLVASGPSEKKVDVALAHAGQVRVGAAILKSPVFYVVDLGELPQVEGVAFDGLVGYEMFRHFCVQIDYAQRQLTLTEAGNFVPPTDATELDFDFDRLTPIVSGTLDGIPVRLTVDTGSRASLTLNSPFVSAHNLVTKYNAAPESVLGWGVGGAARMRAARFGLLQLGNLDIKDIAGDLYTSTKGALSNPDQAGNLGGGILKRFTVTFNYVAKLLYLAPNSEFDKIQAFDRSGLWLNLDGSALKVADIASCSSATRADIQEGDRIIAIDGESVTLRTLAKWRERLRQLPVGTGLTFQLLRDGLEITAKLVLADRISPTWNG
jgi:hypothetical protein